MLNEISTTARTDSVAPHVTDDHNTNPHALVGRDPVEPGRESGDLALGLEQVEPWPDPVAGPELLAALREVIKTHVVLPPFAADTLALWALHTYAFELRDVSTYIGLGSPQKRCGKSTLLSVLSELVHRPVVASNISPPALFRAIEEARPTLLIDEADTFLQSNDELRGILNAGYTQKTAYVIRVTGEPAKRKSRTNSRSRLVRFSCWCPKIIAAIGRLPETLLDRCIPITLHRKKPNELCLRPRDLDGMDLRRKCARFVLDRQTAIASARLSPIPHLNDRAADIWEPLIVLADIAGGDWPKLARDAALTLSAGVPDTTAFGSLLLDIYLLFYNNKIDRALSRALVACLNQNNNRPWAESRKSRPIDELWLAHQLRPYGVRPRHIWFGKSAGRGYLQSDFEDLWSRYISPGDIDALKAELQPAQPSNTT